jgi:putative ABC transport system permease protein
MRYPSSTHLAWSMLVRDTRRFLGAVCAIVLATTAMFVSLGFYTSLNDAQARVTAFLDADLVIFHRGTGSLTLFLDISRPHLYRLSTLEGVTGIAPLHQGAVELKNPETDMYKSIQFFAFQPETEPLSLPELKRNARRLGQPGTIIFDALSREHFGDIEAGMVVEVDGTPLRVIDTTRFGPNFSRHGTIFMDVATLESRLAIPRGELISLGLVRTEPGVDLAVLEGRIRAQLPGYMDVMTPDELYYRELLYTLELTPAGAILALGLLVALVVGCVIAYQVLFTEVTDHLAQFATCKAMGFSPGFLKRTVLQEALLLTVLGFPLGILATLLVYAFLEYRTRNVMELTPIRVAVGFALTLLMCSVAARMAVQRAIDEDPADLF